MPRENRWQALARGALRDDLLSIPRALTHEVLVGALPNGDDGDDGVDSETAIETWTEQNAAVLRRSLGIVADIKAARVYDTTTLSVALRELRNLLAGRPGGRIAGEDGSSRGG